MKLTKKILNATLYRIADHYVVYHLFPLLRERFLQDFRTHRHVYATWGTAHYVASKMRDAKSLLTRDEILDYAVTIADRPGLFLEFGVFEGESINSIAGKTGRTVHGFDSFEGLPTAWNSENPRGIFRKPPGWLPTVLPNVELHVGWFDKVLPEFLDGHRETVSFIHIDCDLYSSTKTVFDALGDRITSGTIILFDEYFAYPGWEENEFAAFQEFVARNGLQYEYMAYHDNNRQVVVKIL